MTNRRALLFALVCAFVLVPSLAKAQSTQEWLPPPPPPPAPWIGSAAMLDLTAKERLTITVYSQEETADTKRALFVCRTPCRVAVVPGKYRFHVQGGAEKIEADRVIDVRRSQQLSFSLPERSAKTGALTMAITGTVLIPTGLLVVAASALSNMCMDCSEEEYRNRDTPAGVYVGFGMMIAGAILTPLGWVQFARNRKPAVEEMPLSPAPEYGSMRQAKRRSKPAPSRIGFGLAPTRGGASAGIWGTF